MSKYAVLALPFFIVSILSIEPLITNSSDIFPAENSESISVDNQNYIKFPELLAQNYSILSNSQEEIIKTKKSKVIEILITAYSSSPDETDETPFITASGSYVQSGIVAANFLPFGAKIRIPDIFGNQIFVVEDRLHERNGDRVDVWMPTKKEALKFGVKISEIEIL